VLLPLLWLLLLLLLLVLLLLLQLQLALLLSAHKVQEAAPARQRLAPRGLPHAFKGRHPACSKQATFELLL
jgi:hypothetical protein